MKMQFSHLACWLLCAFVAGCGGGSLDCSLTGVSVSPATTIADHNAVSPGNTARFFAFGMVPSGCVSTAKAAIPQAAMRDVTWSVSDPENVSVSNVDDDTYGTATCLHSTSAPVTVTATLPASATQRTMLVGTAKLTCN
jgi:hypothetical protein